jgi:hypothetical protein
VRGSGVWPGLAVAPALAPEWVIIPSLEPFMADEPAQELSQDIANRQAARMRQERRASGIVDADAELGLAVLKLLRSNDAVTRDMLVRRFSRVVENGERGSLEVQEAEAVLHRLEVSPRAANAA